MDEHRALVVIVEDQPNQLDEKDEVEGDDLFDDRPGGHRAIEVERGVILPDRGACPACISLGATPSRRSPSSRGKDLAGSAYVTGITSSDQNSFPVKVGPDLSFNGRFDAFVAKVKPDGTSLFYAGYIGGANRDAGLGIAVDTTGNVYVGGDTSSDQTSFPVTVGPDLNFAGDADAFVAKVSGKPDLTETGEAVVFNPGVVKPGGSITVIDKALDVGLGSSKKSVTRYYLSKDAVRSADDILRGGSRTLPALQPSFGHSSSATATVPANTPRRNPTTALATASCS